MTLEGLKGSDNTFEDLEGLEVLGIHLIHKERGDFRGFQEFGGLD